ncbi:DUF4190 domain-containing protein [Citricoccus sp. SGAir0253]|uniref:DUF4190 domain-containing protein n=1 Tax=Citricoccus sp. SGAir0253 TaxID=2567881 RepID=UPI0010CCBB9D|nr:DUF4190 domain-containing protein [Citricoccus sp. SGAir0253]QCU76828.1 DUF4190 domain-containing protein [Citricoccus sp. SGAir0253]
MADPNARDRGGQGHDPDRYRPFDDPHHPSWYTDAGARPDAGPAPGASPQDPYADQPYAGLPGGPGPYPLHGGYPGAGGPGGRATWTPRPVDGRRTTALGLTALVLGISGVATFGTLLVPQLLAIVFGHLSLRREPDARGLALAGLIMGYVVSGLWVLMILGLVAFGILLA